MQLRFLGAAGEVTGSCYLLETSQARVLIDIGAHQGGPHSEAKNRRFPGSIRPEALDAVLLTHAHIDHTGRVPMLAQHGYSGPIYTTPASIALTGILLRDAAYLQSLDAERESRDRLRHGREPVRPLFDLDDVERVLGLLRSVPYDKPTQVAPGIEATWVDAGHILGSASIHLRITQPAAPGVPAHETGVRTIVFSGDLGPRGAPLLRDPAPPTHADVVILESTYGDRDHRSMEGTLAEFAGILSDATTASHRAVGLPPGKVLIPAFAVGRTQNLIYHIGILRREGRIPEPEVWIDSPMGIEATELYRRHRDVFDQEARAIIDAGDSPLNFPGLRVSRDRTASEALNTRTGITVISASGMCTGGRILHHLRHSLGNPATHVVMVGFQAAGTTGRALVDGAAEVRIMGQATPVLARVHTIGGFSAHAGQSDLLWWMSKLESKPKVFLTHGEQMQREHLRDALHTRLGLAAALPQFGDVVTL